MLNQCVFAVETSKSHHTINRRYFTQIEQRSRSFFPSGGHKSRADLNEADRIILIRDRKGPQEKLGNNQTVLLLVESFAIIQAQARAKERIFPYHGASVRACYERLCVLAVISDLTFQYLRNDGISRLFV